MERIANRALRTGILCWFLVLAAAAQSTSNKLATQVRDGSDVKTLSSDLFPASEGLYDARIDKSKGTVSVLISLTKIDDYESLSLTANLPADKIGSYIIVKGKDNPGLQILGGRVPGYGDLACYAEDGSKIVIASFPPGPGKVAGSFDATCTENKKLLHITGTFAFVRDK